MRRTIKLWSWGAAGGLLFGLGYWYVWGCWTCAASWGETSIIGFCVVTGGLVASMVGKDLVRS